MKLSVFILGSLLTLIACFSGSFAECDCRVCEDEASHLDACVKSCPHYLNEAFKQTVKTLEAPDFQCKPALPPTTESQGDEPCPLVHVDLEAGEVLTKDDLAKSLVYNFEKISSTVGSCQQYPPKKLLQLAFWGWSNATQMINRAQNQNRVANSLRSKLQKCQSNHQSDQATIKTCLEGYDVCKDRLSEEQNKTDLLGKAVQENTDVIVLKRKECDEVAQQLERANGVNSDLQQELNACQESSIAADANNKAALEAVSLLTTKLDKLSELQQNLTRCQSVAPLMARRQRELQRQRDENLQLYQACVNESTTVQSTHGGKVIQMEADLADLKARLETSNDSFQVNTGQKLM